MVFDLIKRYLEMLAILQIDANPWTNDWKIALLKSSSFSLSLSS